MTTDIHINQPEKRRGILVLKQTDIDIAKNKNQADFMLDDQLLVLPYPLTIPDNIPPTLVGILKEATPGELFLQSPYDANVYARADVAQVQFSIDKYILFSELCCLLGAKEVSVNEGQMRSKDGATSFKVDAEHHVVEAKIAGEKSFLDKFVANISLYDKFSGGNANLNSAEELLQHNNLLHDRQIRSLINLRKEGMNQLVERTLNINMISEMSNRLSLWGRIKTPGIQLSCEYKEAVDENSSFNVSVTVKF